MKMMELHLAESRAMIFVNPVHVVLIRNATAASEVAGCHVHLSDKTEIVACLTEIDAEPAR